MMDLEVLKMALVGNRGTGKTSLIREFLALREGRPKSSSNGSLNTDCAPTFFRDQHFVKLNNISLTITDYSGETTVFERQAAPTNYDFDVVLICFSLDDRSSFTDAGHRWLSAVQRYCSLAPATPYIFVGTMSDLRQSTDQVAVSEGRLLAKNAGAFESFFTITSIKNLRTVTYLFENAIRLALKARKLEREKWLTPLQPAVQQKPPSPIWPELNWDAVSSLHDPLHQLKRRRLVVGSNN